MDIFTRIARVVFCLMVAGLAAGCVAQEPVTECEPGVGEIGQMGTVPPPGC